MDHNSHRLFGEGYFLTAAMMRWFWRQYLRFGVDGLNSRISPLLAGNLAGLPPATVFTAEFDVLRDEGEDYARALERAGVPVYLKRWDNQIHDFTLLHGSVDDANVALREAATALHGGFG